jgi:hypothetical protein
VKQLNTVKEDRKDAWSTIHTNLWGGLGLTILGVIIAAGTKPSVTADTVLGGTTTSGSTAGYDLGLMCAGLGSLFITIGLIAWGITLGVRASRADAPTRPVELRPEAPRPLGQMTRLATTPRLNASATSHSSHSRRPARGPCP